MGLEAAICEAESLLYPQVVSPLESELKVSECLARWFNTRSILSDTETVYRYNVHAFLDWVQHQGLVSWGDFRLDHLLLYTKELSDAGKSRRTIELRCAPVVRCQNHEQLAILAPGIALQGLCGPRLREVFPGRRIEPKGLRRTLPTQTIREGWGGYALERYLGHSQNQLPTSMMSHLPRMRFWTSSARRLSLE